MNLEKLRALIAARAEADRDFETKGAAAHYVAAVEASKAVKEWLGTYAEKILEHIERVERNRDMWKGQCERQAEKIAALIAREEKLEAALKECADDLEAELFNSHQPDTHPVNKCMFDRDMSTVRDARAALEDNNP